MNRMYAATVPIIAATLLACASLFNPAAMAAAGVQNGEDQSQEQMDLSAARADRRALVADNMPLTKEQAAKFWPLYEAYESKMDRIEKRHAAEINSFAQHYETLTDADADKKLDEVIAIRQARLDVQKEYIPKFRAAISSIETTRFFQIDNKLNALIQCDLARALPLARHGATQQ
jgi:Spy/CpxP family protein refolding chaperone